MATPSSPRSFHKQLRTLSSLKEMEDPEASRRSLSAKARSQFKYVKHKVEAVDKDNLSYSYSVIEGDALMNNALEKIVYETKVSPSPSGVGSICKSTSKYYTIGEFEIKEEQIKAGKDKSSALYKAIEAYLLANPDAY
ncbi:hypothetical protein Q3G72_027508 [Acer saccharum]|nr:hypothetical protein Q3G72_006027 [Acer saccharum]KAK1592593.1 hypothetical protein Q3G72_027508 [Acer saccharum]